tara:strand:- start:777 stop:932 length:156 start_codon:yes stop_codon:yes gene_type:complete
LLPLVKQLESDFGTCQQFACRALYRLAAHIDNQARIVDAGGLVGLIKLCKR